MYSHYLKVTKKNLLDYPTYLLIIEETIKVELQNNPNNLTSNLTVKMLTDTEMEILKYSLKHGTTTLKEKWLQLLKTSRIKMNKKDYVIVIKQYSGYRLFWKNYSRYFKHKWLICELFHIIKDAKLFFIVNIHWFQGFPKFTLHWG